jgi:hypothetical protein
MLLERLFNLFREFCSLAIMRGVDPPLGAELLAVETKTCGVNLLSSS